MVVGTEELSGSRVSTLNVVRYEFVFDIKKSFHLDKATGWCQQREMCSWLACLDCWIIKKPFIKARMGKTMEPLFYSLFYLVIFCKTSPMHSFTGAHLTPCFTCLDCKYDISQSSVLLCITKVVNYKIRGVSVTIWVHAQVKVEPCKRIIAMRSGVQCPYHSPGLAHSHFAKEFLPRKQLHFMHNSKPVSGVAATTAGQGCPSQDGCHRWLWEREAGRRETDTPDIFISSLRILDFKRCFFYWVLHSFHMRAGQRRFCSF